MKVELTLYQMLAQSAAKFQYHKALLFRGKYLTYDDLKQKVDYLASGLVDFGFKKNDVITFALPNVFEAVFGFYASAKVGVICHMVHPITPVKQMKKYMSETGSQTLVILDTFYNHYQDLLEDDDISFILVNPVNEFNLFTRTIYRLIHRKKLKGHKQEHITHFSSLYQKKVLNVANINPHATAVYLHSGGTSGQPKTIELSHHAINYLASQTPYIMGIEDFKNKHMLSVLPMFHGFGLCMGIHGMLAVGGVDTLMPKFNAKKTAQLIAKNQVNYIIGVPSLFESLLKEPAFDSEKMKHVDQAFIGGDYVSMDLKNRFNKQMKKNGSLARLLEGYGLTEVVAVACVNTLREHDPKTVGKPLPGIDIQIKDLKTDQLLPENETGEIIIAGPSVMNGYLNDSDTRDRTFFDIHGKTYVRTGDLGMIDPQGFVHFKQRLKRIIKVLGIPVLPAEIENFLMDYPQISEVCAVSAPDKDMGHVVKLFIVWNQNKEKIPYEDIKQAIKENISQYAVPKDIVVLDALPKTPIGKIDVLSLEKI